MKLFFVTWLDRDRYGNKEKVGHFCVADTEYEARIFARDTGMTDLYKCTATLVLEQLEGITISEGMLPVEVAETLLRERNLLIGIEDGEAYVDLYF